MVGSLQDAEDLVQETYFRAWRSLDGFKGESSLRTWLYQIATNRCLTKLAKAERRVLPSGISAPELNPDAAMVRAGTEVSWLQPAPDALLMPDSADPSVQLAAREGLRLALIASLQHLPATPIRTWFKGRGTCIPFLRNQLLKSPGDWHMVATHANGQPAATVYVRDFQGSYRPYGVCVLTVTEVGISRISSFGDPGLVALFGFEADRPGAKHASSAPADS